MVQRRASIQKGQVAMEYLATYGWALLAMFLVIAFLVGSGIFNPNRFVSEECTFSPNLPCGSFFIAKAVPSDPNDRQMTIRFNLTNAMGFPIFIRANTAKVDGIEQKCDIYLPANPCYGQPGIYLQQGNTTGDGSGASIIPGLSVGYTSPNKVTVELKRVYMSITFRNCQDLPLDKSGATPALGTCNYPGDDPDYPWHVVSGRMVAFVRNA